MSAPAVAALVSVCLFMSGLFLSNMFLMMIIGEINRRRPEGEQTSYLGFTLPKMGKIVGDYRRLYPQGKLHIYTAASVVMAILGLASLMICLTLLGKAGGGRSSRSRRGAHLEQGALPPQSLLS